MSASVKRGPRAARFYRANGRVPTSLLITARARPRKSGKSWPNPQNPVLGKRENFRRLQQMRRAAYSAQVSA